MLGQYDKLKTFEHAAAAFKATKPSIFINHDQNIPADVAFAESVKKQFKDRGFNVVTLKDIMQGEMLPGSTRDSVFEKRMYECSHMIDIMSPQRGEGRHNKATKIIRERSEELSEGHTHRFPLAKDQMTVDKIVAMSSSRLPQIGTWENDSKQRDFVIGMMAVGPGGRGYEAPSNYNESVDSKIDWSSADFAHLLQNEATTQDLSRVAHDVVRDGRFDTLVVVDTAPETLHDVPTMAKAISISLEENHHSKSERPGVKCSCGRCGTDRPHFTIDKAESGTHGVIIVPNDPCENCGVTAMVSPVPGFTLQNALDKIYS